MPAPGDQHKTTWSNPFEEVKPRVSEWTAKEIATIASRLDKQLGPEYISSRAGPGGARVHYLTAEKCITLANEVFGFNGWSSSIQNIQVDFADENPQTQRVSIGLSVIVRVTLRDGTYHEDIGYGSIENAKGKAMAFEKAKKEGTTDALKRALRNFGNVLGNCVYDKEYLNQVTKLKAQPVRRFDEENLHRHADFAKAVKVEPAPVRVEPAESFDDFLGELDEADFCVPDDGHPDEVVLQPAPKAAPPITPKPPQFQPPPAPPQDPSEPVSFLSARSTLGQEAAFNPKAESPSIRRTPGIDHSTSKPLARNGQHVAPSSSQAGAAPAPARPGVDQARRIGAPGGTSSPLANRSQYKPPTMKRAPLVDMTNAKGGGEDAKRQKVA